MAEQRLGVIMNGVTGRMGTNQHLARSVMAIRREGGVLLADGTRVIPDPILVGRSAGKLRKLAAEHGVERWTTDLDEALRNPDDAVFFDAASTRLRPAVLKRAIAAKKHIYCEKPWRPPSGRRSDSVARRNMRAFGTEWCKTNCGCRTTEDQGAA